MPSPSPGETERTWTIWRCPGCDRIEAQGPRGTFCREADHRVKWQALEVVEASVWRAEREAREKMTRERDEYRHLHDEALEDVRRLRLAKDADEVALETAWAKAERAEEALRELGALVERYLDHDGSRGVYEALTLAEARRELNAALSGPQFKPIASAAPAPGPGEVTDDE